MSEYKPRIGLENRTKLETVIPLDTPFSIFLDPSNVCNANCSWCPTGSRQARKFTQPQLMDLKLYTKIIDSIVQMPSKVKTLRLYADGEPLMNPNFPDMVKYAKQTGFFGEIDTTTNGLLLDYALSCKILDAGLDKIIISVPAHYSYEYMKNIQTFCSLSEGRCTIYIKAIKDSMNELAQKGFLEDFSPYCDYIYLENLAPCWPDFDVKDITYKGIYNQELGHEPDVCPYIFYSTKINSDGTVSLCFLDWRHSIIMGDLKFESFKSIWDGLKYRYFRRLMLKKIRKDHCFCSKCQQLKYGAADNIDPFAEELLEKL